MPRPRKFKDLQTMWSFHNNRAKPLLFAQMGNCCVKCGFTDIRALQLDHKYRATEPRNTSLRSGRGLYRALLRGEFDLNDFQLLCANCKLDQED